MVAAIVQHKDFDGQLMSDDRLQLLQVHHDATVARYADDSLIGAGKCAPDCRRQIEPHRCASRIMKQPLTWSDKRRLKRRHACRSVSGRYNFAFSELAEQRLHKTVWIHVLCIIPILWQYHGKLALSFLAPRQPRRRWLKRYRVSLRVHQRNEVPQIGVDRQIDFARGFTHFLGINIYCNLVGGAQSTSSCN